MLTLPRWNFRDRPTLFAPGSGRGRRCFCRVIAASRGGETIVSVAPSKPVPATPASAKAAIAKPVSAKPLPGDRQKPQANDRQPNNASQGTPVPDSKVEAPPVIRRAELVAFALVALLIICVVAVLYVARAFFLPITMAFVVGTMLSPVANLLERYRIPRAFGAVVIVTTVGAGAALMVGLISS